MGPLSLKARTFSKNPKTLRSIQAPSIIYSLIKGLFPSIKMCFIVLSWLGFCGQDASEAAVSQQEGGLSTSVGGLDLKSGPHTGRPLTVSQLGPKTRWATYETSIIDQFSRNIATQSGK